MLWLLACDVEKEPASVLPDPASVPLGGACPAETRFGGFEISAAEGYSTVGGSVADGVVPTSVPTEVATDGECRLLRRENPFCDPGCDAGEACDLDGTCVPYPENQDVGEVSVAGLAVDLRMTATPPSSTYFDTSVPHPVYEPDATIELVAGDLTLHGVGPEELVSDTLDWTVGEGSLAVSWDPPVGIGRSTVELRLTVDQHGATPLSVVCDFADDGAGEVPEALIDALLDAGVTGWPNGMLTRRTADQAAYGAGCVELLVTRPVLATVTVSGHTPCDSFDDCPPGQFCDLVLETCL